jgi:cell division protein FtsL
MAQLSSDIMAYSPTQKLLRKQGVGARQVAVQNKFVKRWAVWIILLTVLALFYVWSRVKVVEMGYELSGLNSSVAELSKQIGALEADIARLKSPKRLEEVAKTELGMQTPTAEQTVLVQSQKAGPEDN